MKILMVTVIFFISCVLSGCDGVKSTLHLMPNQDAQQCIDGERFKFKDPDVLFVANLGDRGLGAKPDEYWVRYKAKNSYGAYIQGNMFCRKDQTSGKWARDTSEELSAIMTVTAGLLATYTNKMSRENETYYCGKLGSSSLDETCLHEQNLCLHSGPNFVKCMKQETPHCDYKPTDLDIKSCKETVLKRHPHSVIEIGIPEKSDKNIINDIAVETVMTSADNLAEYLKMRNQVPVKTKK